MLTKSPYNKSTLFATSRILQHSVYQSLLGLAASYPLTVRNLDETLIYALNRQRLRFPQGEALLLLCLESHVSCVAVLVIDGFKRSAVKPTDLLQSFRYRRSTQAKLERYVWRRDCVCRQPHLLRVRIGNPKTGREPYRWQKTRWVSLNEHS